MKIKEKLIYGIIILGNYYLIEINKNWTFMSILINVKKILESSWWDYNNKMIVIWISKKKINNIINIQVY